MDSDSKVSLYYFPSHQDIAEGLCVAMQYFFDSFVGNAIDSDIGLMISSCVPRLVGPVWAEHCVTGRQHDALKWTRWLVWEAITSDDNRQRVGDLLFLVGARVRLEIYTTMPLLWCYIYGIENLAPKRYPFEDELGTEYMRLENYEYDLPMEAAASGCLGAYIALESTPGAIVNFNDMELDTGGMVEDEDISAYKHESVVIRAMAHLSVALHCMYKMQKQYGDNVNPTSNDTFLLVKAGARSVVMELLRRFNRDAGIMSEHIKGIDMTDTYGVDDITRYMKPILAFQLMRVGISDAELIKAYVNSHCSLTETSDDPNWALKRRLWNSVHSEEGAVLVRTQGWTPNLVDDLEPLKKVITKMLTWRVGKFEKLSGMNTLDWRAAMYYLITAWRTMVDYGAVSDGYMVSLANAMCHSFPLAFATNIDIFYGCTSSDNLQAYTHTLSVHALKMLHSTPLGCALTKSGWEPEMEALEYVKMARKRMRPED